MIILVRTVGIVTSLSSANLFQAIFHSKRYVFFAFIRRCYKSSPLKWIINALIVLISALSDYDDIVYALEHTVLIINLFSKCSLIQLLFRVVLLSIPRLYSDHLLRSTVSEEMTPISFSLINHVLLKIMFVLPIDYLHLTWDATYL